MTDLFVDSGAPTFYNKYVRLNKGSGVMGASIADRKYDDFSFLETEEYLSYRQDYCDYLLKHENKFKIYANFDIINNAEETWNNQKWFESKGLKPVPVFHFGSDIKWLQRYIEEGYDYIAVGGLIPNSFSVLKEPLDQLWLNYLTDDRGFPIIKVHGFAVTSPRLIHRYPWFSVDSTSWVKFGMYGCIVMPKQRLGKPDYERTPSVIFLSVRSPQKEKEGQHIDTLSNAERAKVLRYIEKKGFILGKSKVVKEEVGYKVQENETIIKREVDHFLVERVIIKGVSNDNVMRDTLNAMYYQDLGNSAPPWPWAVKFKKSGFF